MNRQQPSHRPRSQVSSSNTKLSVLGTTAGTVPPAWRLTAAQQRLGTTGRWEPRKGGPANTGSKILMSQFPPETVGEKDIEELFRETIGPLFDVFVIYNNQGKSKGMAVVNFQRSGDAAEARKKYNGKIIDGRRPLKIELIADPPDGSGMKEKTLLERLASPNKALPHKPLANNLKPAKSAVPTVNGTAQPQHHGIQRRKLKKGPRRLKKSREQLDREMEDWRAEAPRFTETNVGAVVGVETDGNAMLE